jgi:muramoyltetrapeptide carboxypeptidase
MSSPAPPLLKPPPLRPGDAVGIVAPAGAVDRASFELGCEGLRRLGYRPVFEPSIFEQDLYFAGAAGRRARELQQMFARPDARAILCARGGYGCNYLLPLLDVDAVRRHPKLLIGYSDVTCLLTYLHDAAGLVTLHGPMLQQDFSRAGGVHLSSWQAATEGRAFKMHFTSAEGVAVLREGSAEGVLYGGCLSLMAASLGTPYAARTEGKLLFLEDVNLKPYQLDRLLMQCKLAGKLEGAQGIVFGEMRDCGEAAALQEVARRVLGDLGVPVVFGVPSGHVSRSNLTLPIGVRARLEAQADGLRLETLEAAAVAGKEEGIGQRAGGRG